MNNFTNFLNHKFLLLASILFCLYLTITVNYLLFHSLVEIFSIVVAFSLFMITWNSKRYIKNQYLLFIGTAYLFVAFLDLLHTLAYKGMPIFTDYDYYANQLWIGARYMESITLFIAFYFLGTGKRINPKIVLTVYSVFTIFIVLSIFYWKIFPICFVDGVGLTEFKKVSEFVICLILIASIVLLNKNRYRFEARIFYILLLSMVCTILSELAFTFYINNYGISNIIGHYFKLISFFLIYKAIIETGIQNPYEMIFKELENTNINLSKEIDARIKVEEEREKLISDLKTALAEVKKLSGLLPICSHCKKIRDDKGYWNQIEDYIHKHSEAKFSHSICQECAKIYYPDYDIYDPA